MWRTFYSLASIYRHPYLTLAQLAKLQALQFNKIIKHAKDTVPYYRQTLADVDLPSASTSGAIDINAVPITRKKALLNVERSLIISSSVEERKLHSVRTGGSTGSVLEVSFDDYLLGLRTASHHRAYVSNGYRFSDKVANLQFVPVHSNKYLSRIGFLRRYTIPFEAALDQQIALLQSIEPEILEGYPSRLSQVSKRLIQTQNNSLQPKLVVSNSEKLEASARNTIRKAFGVDPMNVYDSWEFGLVAWECPNREGLHVNEDLLKVEVLKEDGTPAASGEQGELVITDLFNRAMPLIRYATGDVAIRAERPCSCGRTFFLLKEIAGRLTDMCHFPDGTSVVATFPLAHIAEEVFPEILEYQCIQTKVGELDVSVVVNGPFSEERKKAFRQEVLEFLPFDRIRINVVDKIHRTSSGKHKPFISHLPAP